MLIITIVLPFIIRCVPSVMSKVPQNYIILFIFTFALSYLVAAISSCYKPSLVFMAAFMTFAMVVAITLYSITTKTDFTIKGGAIFIVSCGVLLVAIFGFFTSNKFFHILLCVIIIMLYGVYLIYDTQLILGKGKEMFENDEYIVASFELYSDIVYMFLEILRLLGLLSNNN